MTKNQNCVRGGPKRYDLIILVLVARLSLFALVMKDVHDIPIWDTAMNIMNLTVLCLSEIPRLLV